MKKELQDFLGQARWTRLESQAIEQGRDLDHVCKDAVELATAKHPDNGPAAAAFAAIRVLITCNSQPSIQDIHNYELAQKSAGQHPQELKAKAPREEKTVPQKPPRG